MKSLTNRTLRFFSARVRSTMVVLLLVGQAGCLPIVVTPPDSTPRELSAGRGGEGRRPEPTRGSPQPDHNIVGTLRTNGPNVFVNRRAARDNEIIRSGDNVSTGQGGYAKIDFIQGGFMELAPDTDPDFRLLREGLCLWMRILTGKVFIDTNGSCTEVQAPDLVATIHSQVHLDVTKQRTTLTVLQGQARLMRANKVVLTVNTNEELSVNRGAQPAKRAILRPEIENATKWRLQKFLAPSPIIRDPAIRTLPSQPSPIR